MSDGERASSLLELLYCSSEDVRFPAANLTLSQRASTLPSSQLAVWESEKFCEFPQELVFRVNRGLPTCIEQVNLLSHPFKVATRVEIFTSAATSNGIHDGRTGVRFERLGFVCFRSNEKAQRAACELQEVQLPQPSKITLLRLVLHPCHQTRTNLFSQVGLASVAAFEPQKIAKVALPLIPPPLKSASKKSPRRRVHSLYDTTTPSPAQEREMRSPRAADIWIQDTQKMKTPEQIFADIQIGKQLVQYAGNEKQIQPWISLEQEASHLINLLGQSTKELEDTKHVNDLDMFAEFEQRRYHLEKMLSQKMSSSPRPRDKDEHALTALQGLKAHDILKRLKISQWQEREALLWQLAECSQVTDQSCQIAITGAEALEILAVVLDDTNAEVFAAGCGFLRALLTCLPYFQDAAASKLDVTEIVARLTDRLGAREAPIRNVAAFTILKVAGTTRTRGTFVTHLTLKDAERRNFQHSDQQLLAILKLLAALLLSFHCCASFDIAPRRILRFLLLSGAAQHEISLIREAAKQVVLALCCDVDEEFIMKHYVKKLSTELQERYELSLNQSVQSYRSRKSTGY